MLPTLSPCVSSISHPRGSLTSSNTVFTTFSRAFSYPRRTESFVNKTPSLLPLKTAGIRNAAKQPASPVRAKSGSFPPQTHPRGASPDRNRDFFQTRDRWRQAIEIPAGTSTTVNRPDFAHLSTIQQESQKVVDFGVQNSLQAEQHRQDGGLVAHAAQGFGIVVLEAVFPRVPEGLELSLIHI